MSLTAADRGMKRIRLPGVIQQWYDDYLHNRIVHADLKQSKIVVTLDRGTPQGGVLSPLLWNIVFDEMLDIFRTGPVRALGYADDGSLLVCGKDPHTLVSLLQAGLDKVTKWGQENGLNFSPTKTVAVVFGARKTKSFPTLRLNGQTLRYSTSVKYLGVLIDNRLQFRQHIQDRCKKACLLYTSPSPRDRG